MGEWEKQGVTGAMALLMECYSQHQQVAEEAGHLMAVLSKTEG